MNAAATKRKAGKIDPMTGRLVVTDVRSGADAGETATIRSMQAQSLLAEIREEIRDCEGSADQRYAGNLGHAVQELIKIRNFLKGFDI